MTNFITMLTKSKTSVCLQFSGILDDAAGLKELDLKKFDVIELDLKNIERVRSDGIRLWLAWLSTLDQKKKYYIRNCSRLFVNQANLISGLVPSWMEVKSMEIPYFCQKCGDLFGIMIELNGGAAPASLAETADCPKCKLPAEIDVDPERYLRFLSEAGRPKVKTGARS